MATPSDSLSAQFRLITFPVSHYCEKARWALARLNIFYIEERHAPLFHRMATGRVGGKSVPVLIAGAQVFTDSKDILNIWIRSPQKLPSCTLAFLNCSSKLRSWKHYSTLCWERQHRFGSILTHSITPSWQNADLRMGYHSTNMHYFPSYSH